MAVINVIDRYRILGNPAAVALDSDSEPRVLFVALPADVGARTLTSNVPHAVTRDIVR